jgi:hypothetical protein
MASRLNPYLTFDGNTLEAMEFYQKALCDEVGAGTPPPYVTKLIEEALAVIRAQLDDAAFSEAWKQGHADGRRGHRARPGVIGSTHIGPERIAPVTQPPSPLKRRRNPRGPVRGPRRERRESDLPAWSASQMRSS